jgi:CheY-like chemotaxis protein
MGVAEKFSMPSVELTRTSPPKSRRILYVDDEPGFRFAVAKFLRSHGHFVETARDGSEGLRMITPPASGCELAFDVVITDLDLPELDGVGLIRALRAASLPLRVVVYSDDLPGRNLAALQSLNVDAIVSKVDGPELFAAAVAQLD